MNREKNEKIMKLNYYQSGPIFHVKDNFGYDNYVGYAKYNFCGIFSDVDINFNAKNLTSVTSLNLDSENESKRSSSDFPTQIKQLLIDVQALDDADISAAAKNNPSIPYNQLNIDERMKRFVNAFNSMFNNLVYSRIENVNGHKSIIFKKYNKPVEIDNLSSGEKQIVYRGCFLLKDINSMNGAFVFIDEPEISLHPSWQNKIMDFYKNIFTDQEGKQTSQIFTVTHSPFVVHNNNRKNDKVIVLQRNDSGEIEVRDKAEYYKCDTIEAVADAFSVNWLNKSTSTVYLEGRTDEKYFKRALEVFGYDDIPFEFKWIGYINDKNCQEENTGKDALNKAVQFLIANNWPFKNVCLFDCDTNKSETDKNNVYTRIIPTYKNSKKMKKGIENALILDSIDTSPYYTTKVREGDYGDDNTITEFNKMDFCDYICSLSDDELKVILANLEKVIESLISIFK